MKFHVQFRKTILHPLFKQFMIIPLREFFPFKPKELTAVLDIFNLIFTGVFIVEFLLKIIGYGPYGYIKDSFNLFDGTIVIIRYGIFIYFWTSMISTKARAVCSIG